MSLHEDHQREAADRRRPAEVRLTQQTMDYMQLQVQQAVSEGIKGAMTEETAARFWAAGLTVLQKQATQHAGRFVLGGLWGLARKASLFFMLGGIVYALGGWAALAALAKTIFGK